MRMIRVAPLAEGWGVSLDGVDNPMVYSSGRAAETAAKTLASQLAAEGEEAEIRIELRDRSLAARLRCAWGLLGPIFAPLPAAEAPA